MIHVGLHHTLWMELIHCGEDSTKYKIRGMIFKNRLPVDTALLDVDVK